LRVGSIPETITVSGETPVVDVQSTTRQRVMHREILRFGRNRANVGVDIYNALNGSSALSLNNAFGAWQQPNEILLARFVKLNMQFDF